MDKEELIVCRTLQYLSAPVLADFVKNYLRGGFKKFLKDTGQTFDIAKQLVKLTDGDPGDPKRHQPCPIADCKSNDDSFYFQATDHTFHCSKCKFSGDIIDLVKRAQSKKSNVAKTASFFLVATRRKAKKADNGTSPKNPGPEPKKLKEATEWLEFFLRNGRQPYQLIKDEWKKKRAYHDKFTESTVRKAADKLKVKKTRDSFGPGSSSFWELPGTVGQNTSPSKKKGSP